jgi:hypothetical protein
MVDEFPREIGNGWAEEKQKTEDGTLGDSVDLRGEGLGELGGDLGKAVHLIGWITCCQVLTGWVLPFKYGYKDLISDFRERAPVKFSLGGAGTNTFCK